MILAIPLCSLYNDRYPQLSPSHKRMAWRSVRLLSEALTHVLQAPPAMPAAEAAPMPIGLKWDNVGANRPRAGRELEHAKLADTLLFQTTFTRDEWDSFRIADLQADTYHT